MMRKLFAILSAVSLVLCVATCALWVRSYRWTDGYVAQWSDTRQAVLGSQSGTVWLGSLAFAPKPGVKARFRFDKTPGYHNEPTATADDFRAAAGPGFLGFAHIYQSFFFITSWAVGIPCWFLAMMFAAVPALWGIAPTRRKPSPGLCPDCGYDLRATPGRCPECGAAPTPTTGAIT